MATAQWKMCLTALARNILICILANNANAVTFLLAKDAMTSNSGGSVLWHLIIQMIRWDQQRTVYNNNNNNNIIKRQFIRRSNMARVTTSAPRLVCCLRLGDICTTAHILQKQWCAIQGQQRWRVADSDLCSCGETHCRLMPLDKVGWWVACPDFTLQMMIICRSPVVGKVCEVNSYMKQAIGSIKFTANLQESTLTFS